MIETPFVSVDGIIELYQGGSFAGIVLIERKNPPHGWAFPGGFIDIGETVEHALVREMKEEISLDVTIERLLGVYSDPSRDTRFHSIASVFICKADGVPVAADDAKTVRVVSKEEALEMTLAFDHGKMLRDYLEGKTCVTH